MKLATRIFFAYLLITAVCFFYPINHFLQDLRMFFLESVEDALADQANIMASMIGTRMEAGNFNPEDLDTAFKEIYARDLPVRIYGFPKTRVDQRIYITDTAGKVIFDSLDRGNIGEDYSEWLDVARTLKGEYGARTTREDPKDPISTVLHVGAPIMVKGRLAGVLTVAKPTTNINAFIRMEKPKILRLWYIAAALAIVLSLVVSIWLTHPIKRLTRYANSVREGKRVTLPPMGRSELRDMGLALENMREALEGKKYVEQYIHTLTHEIKSPLSAIRGAAELLEERMPPEKRERFLSNIRTEAGRIQDLVDRMLELSELETRQTLHNEETFTLGSLVNTVLESKGPILSRKDLHLTLEVDENIRVTGDSFLLHQALSNLIQNSIDFSLPGNWITISSRMEGGGLRLRVEDEGPGIPEHYRQKVFDKFFSLQRPDTGKKSTGLGLNFVREVATLHGGEIVLENLPKKGLRAVLILPVT
jgi:two-component system sensor histidine kinase CreC